LHEGESLEGSMRTWAFFFSSKSKQILQGEFGGEDKDRKDLLFSSSPNNIARGREREFGERTSPYGP